MSELIFSLPDNEYHQDIDPIRQYVEQAALFLHKKTGDSITQCTTFIQSMIKSKEHDIINPVVTYTERQPNGDREKKSSSLSAYIYSNIKENRIFAPTFTTYIHPSEKRSLLVDYVQDNISARYKEKLAAFKAKEAGNIELATIKGIEQTNRKLANNALSGAHVSASTPLCNKSAHSTLTSVTRTTASFGNANNEKLISGNRHYWSSHIVINNIMSIISQSDLERIRNTVDRYNLIYPTIEQTMNVVLYSTHLYWSSPKYEKDILELIKTLTPIERAAFVYTGDLYHLKEFNNDVLYIFIQRISEKSTTIIDDPLKVVKELDEDILNLAHQICNNSIKGFGKDYKKMHDHSVLNDLVATAINIYNILLEYKEFIQTFFTTLNIPASVAFFPSSIRRSALTSDTDSTIFTVQDWVKWYMGSYIVNEQAIGVAAVIVFLASQTITHVLAILSSNLNYSKEQLHRLAMKNEFRFDVFIPTQVSKHYLGLIGCQEGNVFSEYEKEIKGVHLKSSNAPIKITETATKLMIEIMNKVVNNESLSIVSYIDQIANIEREIKESLIKGHMTYYRSGGLKDPTSYKLAPEKSPYIHHILWDTVFSHKYGAIETPPYDCIKIPTTISNISSLKDWLASIPDQMMQSRLAHFMTSYNKTSLPTIYLSKSYVLQNGIPSEIVGVIDADRIILDICKIFYIILETLGYYKKPNLLIMNSM